MAKQELVTAILERTYETESKMSGFTTNSEEYRGCKRYLNRQSVEVLTEIYNIISMEV